MSENIKTEEKKDDNFVRSATFERGHIFMPGYNVLMVARIKGQFSETGLRSAAPPLHKKNPTVKKSYQETPFKKWFLMDFRKLFRIRIGCVEKCVKCEKISSTNALRTEKLIYPVPLPNHSDRNG